MANGSGTRDDTILYKAYPVTDSSQSLTHLAIAYNSDVNRWIANHIWYYEPLRLVETKQDGDMPCCLRGETCFRDCLDDEWFIVGILMKLTELHPQLIVSVEDNDGQFLLIEAAHCLPKWLKPDTAINRVFLYQGGVHIISQPCSPGDVGILPTGVATIEQSLKCIRNNHSKTRASQDIQYIINKRIQRSNIPFHSAHCLVPIPAAHLITTNNQLITAVVHAFCDRGKEEMKVVRELKTFSPKDHPMIITTVLFPRLLYAKLCHEQWTIPPVYGKGDPSQYKAALLGMKLTCGLEILSRCYSGHAPRSHDTGSGWSQFLSSLCDRGYFRHEIEGSELYEQLLSNAKEYYSSVVKNDINEYSILEESAIATTELLSLKEWREEDYTDTVPLPADDDSWLNMTPEELDRLMDRCHGDNNAETHSKTDSQSHSHQTDSQSHPQTDPHTDTSSLQLDEVVYGMKSFVDQVSSVDGAEFPWSSDVKNDVKFDPNSFVSTLESLIDKLGDSELYDDHSSSDDSVITIQEEDDEMIEIMEQLNNELSGYDALNEEGVADKGSVNVDYNLVANLLESYSGQGGGAGPVSNIMSTLGIDFPKQDVNN